MRIVLLAPSTEPGRSGVGDYALALAGELSRTGHPAVVRGFDEIKDERAFRAFCREFQPDWLSLQFVAYAFDRRGLVWNLGSRLHALADGLPWHVMFHEVWVGAYEGAPWKQRLLGLAQRASIRRSLQALRPRVVHTSNETYRTLLARAGIASEVLPLFGNIPIVDDADDAELQALLARHGLGLDDPAARARQLWIGLFGSLHPVWPPEPFFTHLKEAQSLSGRRPVLISIGRLGPGRALWERLRRDHSTSISFAELGEQPAPIISQLFHHLDGGIATTPYQVIGKSGSAVAMAEHGLPVIVNRTERYGLGLPADDQPHPEPLYLPMTPGLPRLLAALPPRRPARPFLPEVARAFLAALGQS